MEIVCLRPCCESSVLWVCHPFISLHHFVSCRRFNTRRWPNAGLMLAHRLHRWPTISLVLGYHVVFGATLNVGQRHRRRANINPALIQSIVTIAPACRYPQHEIHLLTLKGHAHAKIIKKSVILFWLLNMTIWCKHVQKFFNFSAAHSPVRLDMETKFPYFLFLTWWSIIIKQEFRLYI